MRNTAATLALAPEPAQRPNWTTILKAYREPDERRSVYEIIVTALPFAALWVLSWQLLSVSIFLSLLLAVPAGAFLVRLFLIQHDCGHGAFFRKRTLNNWTGRIIGVLTLTPYDVWQHKHAVHHASTGHLQQRGTGDVTTLTVSEYLSLTPWQRIKYRIYRHPLVMFAIGPAYIFFLQHRVPLGLIRSGELWPWFSAMGTNLGILALSGALIWFVGLVPFLIVQLPITFVAGAIGVWLFYIQHQFENTYWADDAEWDHQDAALLGSSYYDLPRVLHWMTANIGIHHVHHLMSRIPYYRLPEILRDHPELKSIRRINLVQSLSTIGLSLWDERRQRLVSFREVPLLARA